MDRGLEGADGYADVGGSAMVESAGLNGDGATMGPDGVSPEGEEEEEVNVATERSTPTEREKPPIQEPERRGTSCKSGDAPPLGHTLVC